MNTYLSPCCPGLPRCILVISKEGNTGQQLQENQKHFATSLNTLLESPKHFASCMRRR